MFAKPLCAAVENLGDDALPALAISDPHQAQRHCPSCIQVVVCHHPVQGDQQIIDVRRYLGDGSPVTVKPPALRLKKRLVVGGMPVIHLLGAFASCLQVLMRELPGAVLARQFVHAIAACDHHPYPRRIGEDDEISQASACDSFCRVLREAAAEDG